MQYFGLIAFILVIYSMDKVEKIKKIEQKLKRLERKMKGEDEMSKLINELVGQRCLIKSDEAFFNVGNVQMECYVIDVDDEWIKIRFKDKKDVEKTEIIRIDSIESIELIV